jgi:hypothetical protein
MGDAGRRTSVSHLDPNVLNYRLLKPPSKDFLECWLFILMWFVNRGDELKDGVSNSYSS